MASGFDVAGPAAGAAHATNTTMGGYTDDPGMIGSMATPEQLAAMEAAQAQQAAVNEQQAKDVYDALYEGLAKFNAPPSFYEAPPPPSTIGPPQQVVTSYPYQDIIHQMYPKTKDGRFDVAKAKALGLNYADAVGIMNKDKAKDLTEQLVFGKNLPPAPPGPKVTRTEQPNIFSQFAEKALTPIAVQIAKALSDIGRTTTGGGKLSTDTFSDIPSQMPGYSPEDWSGFEDEGGGNVEAIRRFFQDPTYANMPEIDPVSAMAAYDNAIRGIDAVVDERGFTDRGFAQAARDRTQGIFDKFEAGQDFDSMLNEKIGRAFADEALFNKDIELRGQGVEAVSQAFPQGFETDLFNPEAFSKAAENIYGQKLQGAQDVIARAGSRGQLSPRGGRLASESLLSQGPDVQSRLDDILGGVRSEAGGGLDTIRGSALEAAQGYKLGDELFDVTPFTDQASDYLTTTTSELPGRISEAVGTDPLFSAVSALQEGGRQQGMVSGTPSFLDVLAEREGTPGTGRDKRGLGSRGSGVF